jgi:putative ABC transport system permease protein
VRASSLAWIGLTRQPGRAALGVLGVAAVGALLFDMLLLSRGLVLSLRAMLDDAGFDVRVLATDAMPLAGPRLEGISGLVAELRTLPEVQAVVPVNLGTAEAVDPASATEDEASAAKDDAPHGVGAEGDLPRAAAGNGAAPDTDTRRRRPRSLALLGIDPDSRPPWRLRSGGPLPADDDGEPLVLVNANLAERLALAPGSRLRLRGTCLSGAALSPVEFTVVGVADFAFDDASRLTAATTMASFGRTCGEPDVDAADLLLLVSRPEAGGPDAAAAAIRRAHPGLNAFTNEQLVARFERTDFSYFRQISAVLATVTLFFGFLLVTVLLTVSVNQRFGEIAALRAIGFSRRRVVEDVLWESALFVGLGGALAVPIGWALSWWLDSILRAMPGIPADVHFFVFEPRALALHAGLLGATAVLAALYPAFIVARLPIAGTLRREVMS